MRDSNRIYQFCNQLSTAWARVPDWRFGQFMWNIISYCQSKGKDAFFLEEDEMMEMIEKYMKEIKGND